MNDSAQASTIATDTTIKHPSPEKQSKIDREIFLEEPSEPGTCTLPPSRDVEIANTKSNHKRHIQNDLESGFEHIPFKLKDIKLEPGVVVNAVTLSSESLKLSTINAVNTLATKKSPSILNTFRSPNQLSNAVSLLKSAKHIEQRSPAPLNPEMAMNNIQGVSINNSGASSVKLMPGHVNVNQSKQSRKGVSLLRPKLVFNTKQHGTVEAGASVPAQPKTLLVTSAIVSNVPDKTQSNRVSFTTGVKRTTVSPTIGRSISLLNTAANKTAGDRSFIGTSNVSVAPKLSNVSLVNKLSSSASISVGKAVPTTSTTQGLNGKSSELTTLTATPVYIKCVMADGRPILIKKVVDSPTQKQLALTTMINMQSLNSASSVQPFATKNRHISSNYYKNSGKVTCIH